MNLGVSNEWKEAISGDHGAKWYSDIPEAPVDWVWRHRIPAGRITMLVGAPDVTKTMAWCDMVARITTGMPWPDSTNLPNTAADCVTLSTEDDVADTLRPRIRVAGGNLDRVRYLWLSTLDGNWQILRSELSRCRNPRLCVIDPILGFLRHASHTRIREELIKLQSLGIEFPNCGFLLVSHFNKESRSAPLLDRINGSRAFSAVTRSVMLVERHPTDSARRVLLPIKSNLGPALSGLSYRILTRDDYPYLAWDSDPVDDITAEMAVAVALKSGRRKPREIAAEFLLHELADGPRLASELIEKAAARGVAKTTLHRARLDVGVLSRGNGAETKWFPPAESPDDRL